MPLSRRRTICVTYPTAIHSSAQPMTIHGHLSQSCSHPPMVLHGTVQTVLELRPPGTWSYAVKLPHSKSRELLICTDQMYKDTNKTGKL